MFSYCLPIIAEQPESACETTPWIYSLFIPTFLKSNVTDSNFYLSSFYWKKKLKVGLFPSKLILGLAQTFSKTIKKIKK